MLYILKNCRAKNGKIQYILFNEHEKTKCCIESTPEKTIKYAQKMGFKPISPIDSMRFKDYEKTTFGDLLPLPF